MTSHRSTEVRGILLDLDGTLYDSRGAIAGAAELPRQLRDAGLSYLFVTNTTRSPRSDVMRRLGRMGIEVEVEEVLTAPVAAAQWLRQRGARRIYPLLPEVTFEDLADFEITRDEPDYVVVGDLGEEWDSTRLNAAFRGLMAGAELLAVQRNRYWRHEGELTLDAGPFVAALEYASGKTAQLVGKPSREFFATAVELLGLAPDQVAMIGDDLVADVIGAKDAGLTGVAVRTGKYRPEDEDRARQIADAVLDSVVDLPEWLGMPPKS